MNKKVFSELIFFIVFISYPFNSDIFGKNNSALLDSIYQCKYYSDSTLQRNIYTSVDTMPSYEGGAYQLAKDLMKNVDLKKMVVFQPSVVIEYIVDIDGNILIGKVVNKKDDELSEIEIEFLKALKLLDKWIPGKCNGKIVPVKLKERIRLSPLNR